MTVYITNTSVNERQSFMQPGCAKLESLYVLNLSLIQRNLEKCLWGPIQVPLSLCTLLLNGGSLVFNLTIRVTLNASAKLRQSELNHVDLSIF